MYAINSNNYSGACCSVRWFVPLLAPAYLVLALYLREDPQLQGDLLILSVWGLMLGGVMWWQGPWIQRMVPLYWPLVGAAVVSWGAYRYWTRRRSPVPARVEERRQAA
jgi:hypothetical protein